MNPNLKTMNACRMRDYTSGHQFMHDDLGIPPCYSSKKRRNGVSDPRFKRVIQPEVREVCANMQSHQQFYGLEDELVEDRILKERMMSYLKNSNQTALYSAGNCYKQFVNQNACQGTDTVTKDYEPTTTNDPEKMINSKTNLKRSVSDCTLHTKHKVEDQEEEGCHRMRPYPSATRLNRVHNWIKDYRMPEKRRSVITVIGQTQTKPFSKVLNEIKQRRKLAKELDKHALCEAIMENKETPAELKNLVAKVDLLLPDGKLIYSAEKVYMCKEKDKFWSGECEESPRKPKETVEAADQVRKKCDMIPERDSSKSQIGKKSKTKRSTKKLATAVKEKVYLKDRVRSLCKSLSHRYLWWVLLFLCLTLSACTCLYTITPHSSYYLSEFFQPKVEPWYEKLLY